MAKAVIGGSFLSIGEHFVGFVDLLEFSFGVGALVDVRMVLASQPTESFLYFILGSRAAYTQHLIIIASSVHRISASINPPLRLFELALDDVFVTTFARGWTALLTGRWRGGASLLVHGRTDLLQGHP